MAEVAEISFEEEFSRALTPTYKLLVSLSFIVVLSILVLCVSTVVYMALTVAGFGLGSISVSRSESAVWLILSSTSVYVTLAPLFRGV